MNTWIQLKDGVAFAYVESPGFVEGAILLDEGLSWENVKAKKYNNGSWEEPELIYFVTSLINNEVHGLNSTVFSSDVTGDIVSSETELFWIKKEDGTYGKKVTVEPEVIIEPEPEVTE
jgi:hypothetical protein